jgi:hypothetical protein
MLLRATSFPPTRYNWNQHGPLAASFTSSSRVPVRVDSVQMEPALPIAAAATASPRGHKFRRLPTGAAITGRLISCPSTVVCMVTVSRWRPIRGLNRASRKALSLSPIVISRSAAPK